MTVNIMFPYLNEIIQVDLKNASIVKLLTINRQQLTRKKPIVQMNYLDSLKNHVNIHIPLYNVLMMMIICILRNLN